MNVPHLQPFLIAVYALHDIVSDRVKQSHSWENLDASVYGRPGHAMDIGGNLTSFRRLGFRVRRL